ncbi:MAG: hypothetical protein ACHQIG_10280 [Acidimicrobiia bacterium]
MTGDSPNQETPTMTVVAASRIRPDLDPAPRSVRLTIGPAADLGQLLRVAAEVLDVSGAIATAIEPSADSAGSWLRVTCDVDPSDVATLVALPEIADHRVDHEPQASTERCPACELRAYLAA